MCVARIIEMDLRREYSTSNLKLPMSRDRNRRKRSRSRSDAKSRRGSADGASGIDSPAPNRDPANGQTLEIVERLEQMVSELSGTLADTKGELNEVRGANVQLASRLEELAGERTALEQEWMRQSIPSLSELANIRQELNAAQELLSETRNKYDHAVGELLSSLTQNRQSAASRSSGLAEPVSAGWRRSSSKAEDLSSADWRRSAAEAAELDVERSAEPRSGWRSSGEVSTSDPSDSQCFGGPDEPSVATEWRSITLSATDDDARPGIEDEGDPGTETAYGEAASVGEDDSLEYSSPTNASCSHSPPAGSDGPDPTLKVSEDQRAGLWRQHEQAIELEDESDSHSADTASAADLSRTGVTAPASPSQAFACTASLSDDSPAAVAEDSEDQCDRNDDEDEQQALDSINAYMDMLLKRAKDEPDQPISEAVSEVISQSEQMQSFAGTAAGTERFAEPYDQTPIPRSLAPEKQTGLAAMRELANTSARTAIMRSIRRQTREKRVQARLQFLYSSAAIVCGVTLYYTAGQIPRLLAISLILMIAICFAREGCLLAIDARRRSRSLKAVEVPPEDQAAEDDDPQPSDDPPAETD